MKDKDFDFQKKHYEVFVKLKGLLVTRPVLGIYCIGGETQLHTDASSSGYGAVLLQMQKEDRAFHPVMYVSWKTTDAEAKLHSFELETLAVVYAIKQFRPYLFGIRFTIVTDCNALKLTLAKRDLNAKIDRWALFLEEYDFEVVHRSGDRMRHVDALSRIQIYYLQMTEKDLFLEKIFICQLEDEVIKKIKIQVEKGIVKGYEIRDNIVYRKDKERLQLVVPEKLIESVIWKYHDNLGHLGCDKVAELIRRQFYFSRMKERLIGHTEECIVCIAYNAKPIKKEVLLNSVKKGNEPFQTINLDHLGPLEVTRKKNVHILVVVDAFTKYTKLYPTKTTNTNEVCKYLISYFSSYSIPRRIITDRGTAYTSKKFAAFIQDHGITHVKIATSSPNSNGQVERYNRVIVPILAKMVYERKQEWDRVLVGVEYLMNNTLNKAVKDIPAKLLFGVEQRGIGYQTIDVSGEQQVEENRDLGKIRERAKSAIERQQKYNKQYYDRGVRKEVSFSEGDLVMIKESSQVGQNSKLKKKFKGPYVVYRVLDRNRYVIKDVEGYQVSSKPYEGVFDSRSMRLYAKKGPNSQIEIEEGAEDSSEDELDNWEEEYLSDEYEIEYLNSD